MRLARTPSQGIAEVRVFREDKKAGRWLVGINSGNANSGTISLFTSTFHYRSWITEQIRKAGID